MTGPASGKEFVSYEYTTIRVHKDMAAVYADTSRNFGWIVDGYDENPSHAGLIVLTLRRDRRIKNRAIVVELQRKSDAALAAIAALERSKTTMAIAVSLGIGIGGTAVLTASAFALLAGMLALAVPLCGVGLVGWLAGYLAYERVVSNRTVRVAPIIDEYYADVYECAERANRLLV